MPVASVEDQYVFVVFIREHELLAENFSIGLVYVPDGGTKFPVVRYNGMHGCHLNRLEGTKLEDVCHIHKATESYATNQLPPDGYAEEATTYTSLVEAKKVFFDDLKFENHLDFYPELAQGQLNL